MEASFNDDTMIVIDDFSNTKVLVEPDMAKRRKQLYQSPWTGPVYFKKMTPSKPTQSAQTAVTSIPDRCSRKHCVKNVRLRMNGAPMSDTMVQPCMQEAEDHPRMYDSLYS